MSSVIRARAFGVAAIALPAVAVGFTLDFIHRGLGPFAASLFVTLLLVGGLAWACVRVVHFPPVLAMFLTTAPFGFPVLVTTCFFPKFLVAFFLSSLVMLLLAVLTAWAATRLARLQVFRVSRRFSSIAIAIVGLTLFTVFALRFTSIPVHAFDHSWDVHHEIPLDAKIGSMAKRAQFDSYVCGLPLIGRGKLRLLAAARHGSDYDLFFLPTWASDTLVVYRFRVDGKPIWKTCNWAGT